MTATVFTALRQRLHHVAKGDGLKARMIRGGLGSAGIQAANRVLALGLSILLARALGTEGYGVYAYAFAIMSLLMVVAEAGVPTLLMREVAAGYGREQWGLLRGTLRRAMQFVGGVAFGVSLIGLLVLWLLAADIEAKVLYTAALMLLVLPVATLCKTVAHAMQGLHRVVVGQAIDMLLRPLLVLMLAGAAFLFWPGLREPQYGMAAQLLGATAALLVGVQVLRRFVPHEVRSAMAEYRERVWLRSVLPFTLIGGAMVINTHADIIMLGWFTSSEEIGIYRVCSQGGVIVVFALQAVTPVLAPHFSRLYSTREQIQLKRLYTFSSVMIFFLALPIAMIFVFFGGELLRVVFGEEYAAGAIPLAVLAVGYLLNNSFGPVGLLLQMTGCESFTAKALWLSSLANIGMNLALIPTYGSVGAATATATTVVAYHALLRFYAWRVLRV